LKNNAKVSSLGNLSVDKQRKPKIAPRKNRSATGQADQKARVKDDQDQTLKTKEKVDKDQVEKMVRKKETDLEERKRMSTAKSTSTRWLIA